MGPNLRAVALAVDTVRAATSYMRRGVRHTQIKDDVANRGHLPMIHTTDAGRRIRCVLYANNGSDRTRR